MKEDKMIRTFDTQLRSVQGISGGNSEGKRLCGRPRNRQDGIIKMGQGNKLHRCVLEMTNNMH